MLYAKLHFVGHGKTEQSCIEKVLTTYNSRLLDLLIDLHKLLATYIILLYV